MYLLIFVFWYFASVHHSVQITSCWTVLAVFALNSLAVRDFLNAIKRLIRCIKTASDDLGNSTRARVFVRKVCAVAL